MVKTKMITILIILASLLSNIAHALEIEPYMDGWVGLWNEDMIRWAENENQLARLCPVELEQNIMLQCRQQYLATKTWRVPVFSQPDMESEQTGTLVISVSPGQPLQLSYQSPAGVLTAFIPDLYDQDWGYGPYFHQTILVRDRDWFMIPLSPIIAKGWINPLQSLGHSDVIPIRLGQVYTYAEQSIVITHIDSDTFSYRLEHPSDMWCESGEPPSIVNPQIHSMTHQQLYDEQQRLKLVVKYKRGC